MVQSVTLPLLFIAAGADTDAGRATALELAAFTELWHVRFQSVEVTGKERSPAYAGDVVERVETLLERARTAFATLGEAESAPALGEARRLLYAHPELPQAAWLMAELWTLEAGRAEREGSAAVAELLGRAFALEGARQPPFSGREAAAPGASRSATLRVEVTGIDSGDRLEWDGESRPASLTTPAGEHQLRVLRGERVRWAGWVFVSESAPRIRLSLPPITPCSAADLAGTVDGAAGPLPPAEVSCPEWAVARRVARDQTHGTDRERAAEVGRREHDTGRLEIAVCARARCGSWHAARAPLDPFRAPAQVLEHAGFPGWAGWLLAGAGAAAATGVVLWQSGAFEGDGGSRERWVYRGLD